MQFNKYFIYYKSLLYNHHKLNYCMKKIFFAILYWLFIIQAFAQPKPIIFQDSLSYYRHQFQLMSQRNKQTFMQSDSVKAIMSAMKANYKDSKTESVFSFFSEYVNIKANDFNKELIQQGFTPFKSNMMRYGFSFGTYVDNLIFEFTYVTFSKKVMSKKNDEKISSNFISAIEGAFGFSLIKTKSIHIYPLFSLNLANVYINYEKPKLINPNFTSPANFTINNTNADFNYLKIGYSAGLNLDKKITGKELTRLYLFSKVGTYGILGKNQFKNGEYTYKTDLHYGNWFIRFGLRIVSKG